MSGLLLDTHVLLWLLEDSSRLGSGAREAISRAGQVYASAASAWEIAIKSSLGKLTLPSDFAAVLASSGVRDLPVTREHALGSQHVSLSHRDPFDALLTAQARLEQMAFLTADRKLLDVVPEAVDATV
jgi:PIN domain nuclease of toxin-antitoxin system